jgi:hypothetical protein
MRGKGAASLALFATLGVGAVFAAAGMCACATAGNPDEASADGSAEGESATLADGAAIHETGSGSDSTLDVGASGNDSAIDAGDSVDRAAPEYDSAPGDEFSEGEGDAAPVDATLTYHDGAGADAALVPEAGAPDSGVDGSAPSDGGVVDGSVTDSAVPDAAPGDAASGGVSDAASEAAACGGCAAGFSCGLSHYCVAPSDVPAFGHVYVIVMEEQSLTAIQGSSSAPYINSLIATYALATNYTAPDHPSLPNYIELTSGGSQGVACDCQPGGVPNCTAGLGVTACNLLQNSCFCPQSVPHLGDQLDSAGIEWREYAEGMGAPCNPTVDAGANYAVSHVPFLYYDNVYTAPARCSNRVRDYGDFAADLASGAYGFSFISPDTCHDMQNNCTGNQVLQGDDWLSTNVPSILATSGFSAGGRDVLFIVWDEAGTDLGTPPLPLVVVSPLTRHVSTTNAYNHYSLLATIEDGLGVPRLGSAVGAAAIDDVWR